MARQPTATIELNLILRIAMLAGAGLLLAAFFLPWWSISYDKKGVGEIKDANYKKSTQKEIDDTLKDGEDWYRQNLSSRQRRRVNDEGRSAMLFGWSHAAGILGFIFSVLIGGLVVTPWIVKLLRRWAWIGDVITASLSLVLWILSMVWWFGSPGDNVSPYLEQGIIVGPVIAFIGSLLLLAASVLSGVFGLIAFVAWIRSKKISVTVGGKGLMSGGGSRNQDSTRRAAKGEQGPRRKTGD